MYRDSAYCVVVPGDSLITPRIFRRAASPSSPIHASSSPASSHCRAPSLGRSYPSLSTSTSSPTGAGMATHPITTRSGRPWRPTHHALRARRTRSASRSYPRAARSTTTTLRSEPSRSRWRMSSAGVNSRKATAYHCILVRSTSTAIGGY